ncbi:hypothetical protein I7I48_11578 [Histoplasma ohiense]|nr:hypothetical protein I7I48_11578 [Histoplasma ohiense (nom. inval.)]
MLSFWIWPQPNNLTSARAKVVLPHPIEATGTKTISCVTLARGEVPSPCANSMAMISEPFIPLSFKKPSLIEMMP